MLEKEWVLMGHRFVDRCAMLAKPLSEVAEDVDDAGKTNPAQQGPTELSREYSPVFLQFLDAVWQLTQQFPHAFQFSTHYLVAIYDALHASLFGTFLSNCEAHRPQFRYVGRS